MTVRQKIFRSSALGNRPAAGIYSAGELYANFPENQLGIIDDNQDPIDLIGVRYFNVLATYVPGDVVINVLDNTMYQCLIANGPGPFTPTDWQIAIGTFPQRLAGYDVTGLHEPYLGDLNTILVNSCYALSATDVINEPVDFTNDGFITTDMWTASNYAVQTIVGMTASSANKIWQRQQIAGAWTPWELIVGFDPPVPDEVLAGTVIMWPTDIPPVGYMSCWGQEVGRLAEPELFAVLGETYGPGDGSTTFNVPDYRGTFMRGTDAGAGVDPDAATRTDRGDGTTGDVTGSRQEDEFEAHDHPFSAQQNLGGFTDDGGAPDQKSNQQNSVTSPTGGSETRPKNVNINFVIKT